MLPQTKEEFCALLKRYSESGIVILYSPFKSSATDIKRILEIIANEWYGNPSTERLEEWYNSLPEDAEVEEPQLLYRLTTEYKDSEASYHGTFPTLQEAVEAAKYYNAYLSEPIPEFEKVYREWRQVDCSDGWFRITEEEVFSLDTFIAKYK